MARAHPHLCRVEAAAAALGVDLELTLRHLRALYRDVDRALAGRAAGLDLPCHVGCDACCTSSPRLTTLEYAGLVRALHARSRLPRVLAQALAIHRTLGPRIDALPLTGATPHDLALRFRCPLLDDRGRCSAYAARPLVCRLFGQSFDDAGGLYACNLVARHLAGRELTLPRARPWLQALRALPLTDLVQVIPGHAALFEASGGALVSDWAG